MVILQIVEAGWLLVVVVLVVILATDDSALALD